MENKKMSVSASCHNSDIVSGTVQNYLRTGEILTFVNVKPDWSGFDDFCRNCTYYACEDTNPAVCLECMRNSTVL